MRTYTGCLTWRQYAISDKTSRSLEGQFLVIYSIGFYRELNFLAIQQSSESEASYKTPREAEFFVFKCGNGIFLAGWNFSKERFLFQNFFRADFKIRR